MKRVLAVLGIVCITLTLSACNKNQNVGICTDCENMAPLTLVNRGTSIEMVCDNCKLYGRCDLCSNERKLNKVTFSGVTVNLCYDCKQLVNSISNIPKTESVVGESMVIENQ